MRLPENEDLRSKRINFGLPPSGKSRRVSRTSSTNENSNRFLIDHYRHQSNIGSMRTHRPSSEKIYSADSMIVSGGCLKRGRSSDSSRKKSVRFDCQSPPLIRMNSTPSLVDEEKKSVRHREEKTFQINSFQPTRVHLNGLSTFTNRIHLSSTQSNSISLITNPATITISTDQLESSQQPFYLSPPTSSTTTQTSTLIISTPTQYHYYLYPSIRSSNGSVNSISTTSSSSSSNDFDDETCSSSISSSSNQQQRLYQRGETPLESYRELFRDKPIRQGLSSNDFQLKRQFFENKTFVDHQHRKLNGTVRPTRPDSLIRTSIKGRNDSLSSMNMTKTIDFLRDLFPPADEQRRMKTRSMLPTNDQSIDLNEQLEQLKEQERILQDEREMNRNLGNQLIEMVEHRADQREIDKFKLHLNEIETITSVLLKLSSRWSKIENDLQKSSDQTKTSLIEQRDKIRKKHDEAKYLKEGIDRRTRSMKIFFNKYFNDEQCEDLEYFIRMKSRLIVETKDIEEEILRLENQLRNSTELFINI